MPLGTRSASSPGAPCLSAPSIQRFFRASRSSRVLSTPRVWLATLWVAILSMGSLGCASSNALSAAESGDRAALARAIREDLAAGELDAHDARRIAYVVAAREVSSAQGKRGASLVPVFSGCARPLEDPLWDRARQTDDIAARLAMMLLEADLADEADYVSYASDPRPQWRAVGARSLVLPEEHGPRRRELFLDGDERVRLGALRAAAEAPDAGDVAVLFDALRRDPYPMARTVAARALGSIGGEDVVLMLRDAWTLAGPAEREAIASAWASRESLEVGGRGALLWAVDTQSGSPGVAAAVELARAGGAGRGNALALLARSIREGSTHDRVFAVSAAPPDVTITEALIAAKGDDDPLVKVAVLGRIATTLPPKHARPAVQALVEVAKEGSPQARQAAKSALTTAKAPAVVPMLIDDIDDGSDAVRRAAGRGLVRMGQPERAVILAADPDASVRSSISCAILSAP